MCSTTPNFNSRPSARGDRRLGEVSAGAADFNSRPSARGDEWSLTEEADGTVFQFTPLREGRHLVQLHAFSHREISIHAPPRGATYASREAAAAIEFQFTPLREGRLAVVYALRHSRLISIHAPPRGATLARLLSSRME